MNKTRFTGNRFTMSLAALFILTVTTTALATAPVKTGSEKTVITIKAAGVQIVRETYGTGFESVRPFNSEKGATLALMAKCEGTSFIGFEPKMSKLDSFADDKGTDLFKNMRGGASRFGMFPKVSKDGKACMIDFTSNLPPAEGASKISAKGTLVFKCGTTKKDFVAKDVALTVGTKFKLDDIEFTVSKVGKPNWGDAELQISIKAQQSLSRIAKIVFTDENGTDLKASKAGSMTQGFFGNKIEERNYDFKKKIDKVTITATLWTDMKLEKAPFDISVNAGF